MKYEDPSHEIKQDQDQSHIENQSTDDLLWKGGSMMDYRTIIKSLRSGKYEILITDKLNVGDILKWGSDPKEKDGLEKWEVISSERR